MKTTRRAFMAQAAAAGGVIGLGMGATARPARAADDLPFGEVQKADRSLKILILGGTGFIGPHMVRYARERGHTLTLFNRGRTAPELFPNADTRIGDRDPDRDAGLSALEEGEWDAVIDNSGYVPRHVRASAQMLKDRAKQYLFVSTISVYASTSQPGMDEDAEVGTLEDPTVEQVTGLTYGPLKAYCEKEAMEAFGKRACIVRPTLIVGPGDPTGRFTYWPVRVDRGGEVLCPGNPSDPVQYIDARDLAMFCVHCLEGSINGKFNACGPLGGMSIAELIYGCGAVTNAVVDYTWADAAFLAEHEVAPWAQMPVWVPPDGDYAGFGSVSCKRAFDAGMTYRPFADTARDTLHWWKGLADDDAMKSRMAGLTPEREKEVLEAWHARSKEAAPAETAG
ncbi:MAG: NAD-dependent epimerase/dehydratase family protein [Planctomycetota bacterium]|nr:NAD-dependent epimerase/dehydratase family protein [Planctomycetota bacterium]